MEWLNRFLGTKDKEKVKRTEKVDVYVEKQKVTFISDMGKIKKQAQRVHFSTRKAHEESAKLLGVVNDITVQIDRATRP